MARDLSKDVALHDDATSEKHARDKRAAAERRRTHYAPEPAIETKAGASIVEGVFKSPTKGFSFRFVGMNALKCDPVKYTKEALEMSKTRSRYVRIRVRDGKPRKDYGTYKHGAVSMVVTLPPWAVKTVARIGPSELEDLMLRLAEVQAIRIRDVSGRPTFGGGAHLDTAVPHWHLHIPKTDEQQNPYPKAEFCTAGPWLVGSYRIERKFPGLLSDWKRKRVVEHLNRKRLQHLVDVQAAIAVDAALERWIRERGLWADYETDCAQYVESKTREQKKEPAKRLVQAALGFHSKTGVWPLAYQAMTLTMWRIIPREMRLPIMLAIRATQLIKSPISGAIGMGVLVAKTLIRADREPQMMPPGCIIR